MKRRRRGKTWKGEKLRGYGVFHFETGRLEAIMDWAGGTQVVLPRSQVALWERELKFATKGPLRYSDYIGNLLEIIELSNNGKISSPHVSFRIRHR